MVFNKPEKMYKFRNSHEPGTCALYIKLTKERYYCRVNHPDGSNTFHYSYVDDPGQNEFIITERDYKSIRGIREDFFYTI